MTVPKLRILIVGGYGTFGGRIARLLSDSPDLEIVISGRSTNKAENFVRSLAGRATISATMLDRNSGLDASLKRIEPDVVVDASGPFQTYGEDPYRVVEAAIANGIHYIDLADDPDFVMGISQFAAAANDAGVFALSGVSTCPALTGAVFRRISRDFASVEQLVGGIAPSPYSGVGLSVIRAIAGYAGKEISVLEKDKRVAAYPFTEPRRFTISPPGTLPVRSLKYSLVDVPDLYLLANIEPHASTVWFGAAPVPAIFHAALRVLARAVKRGFLPTLAPLARMMFAVMNRISWGEHRGGLFLECRGIDNEGNPRTRSWHLVAEGSIGPMTPALAAVAIIQRVQKNNPPLPGARSAHEELELETLEPMLRDLNVQFGERDWPVPDTWPLFRRVLGSSWASLPAHVAALHDFSGRQCYSGRASVTRGRSIVARVAARLFGFPVSGEYVPVIVDMKTSDGKEIWFRDFDGHRFSSTLSEGEGSWAHLLCEQFGPFQFGIALVLENGRLHYVIRRWSFAGIPMPLFLRPNGTMYESVRDGRFTFQADLTFPLLGHIVTYQGSLEPQVASDSCTAR